MDVQSSEGKMMSIPLGTALLCAAVTAAATSDACSFSLPKQTASTSIRLTAQRNDTGFWTTQFGEYQMLIEHRHFDSTKYDQDDDSTWTIKVKHTSTVYQEDTNTCGTNSEAFGQLESTISKLTDKNRQLHDVVVTEPRKDVASTEQGPDIPVDARPMLPGEDAELRRDDPQYTESEGRRNETSDDRQDQRTEQENLTMTGEERRIMDRHPRSRPLVQDITKHGNYQRGYIFYYGIGWLKLNTSHWQWPEAREACEEDGAHLAIPDTTEKMGAMRQILKDNADILQHTVLKNQVFIGLFYPDSSRNLTTVLGEQFRTENDSVWFPDEPNNSSPGEGCITLHLQGKMRDVPCFYTLPFICEID